jgi:hypothetical protein
MRLAPLVIALVPSLAAADPLVGAASGGDRLTAEAGPAGEVNVVWPVIGISQLKALIPVTGGAYRGELVLGTYFDYAQIIRDSGGRAWIVAAQPGYRQFFAGGFHVELTAATGIRHERHHPGDDATLNDIYVRAWPAAGYQLALTSRVYVNVRATVGILVYRETHADEEKRFVPVVDGNLGVRF